MGLNKRLRYQNINSVQPDEGLHYLFRRLTIVPTRLTLSLLCCRRELTSLMCGPRPLKKRWRPLRWKQKEQTLSPCLRWRKSMMKYKSFLSRTPWNVFMMISRFCLWKRVWRSAMINSSTRRNDLQVFEESDEFLDKIITFLLFLFWSALENVTSN